MITSMGLLSFTNKGVQSISDTASSVSRSISYPTCLDSTHDALNTWGRADW